MRASEELGVIALSLSEWGSVAGIVGVVLAAIGLIFVVVQLYGAAASARAQATIQFQQAFHRSAPARKQVQESFPVHRDTLRKLRALELEGHFGSWNEESDLTPDRVAHAEAVINAMNDVAQYVAWKRASAGP